jgi:hypothetical protein
MGSRVQDVAEAHGLTSQALRSAQIADSALRSAAPERPERSERSERSGPVSGASGAPGALHVSLQELFALTPLRVRISEAGNAGSF